MTDRRALLLAALLAVCVAVWEIDPRWITENVAGLTTLEQSEVNKNALGGSQRIALWAAPLTALLAFAVFLLRARLPVHGNERDWLGAWVAWSVLGAFFGPSVLQSLVFSAAFAVVALATRTLTAYRPQFTAGAMLGALVIFVSISLMTRFLGLASFPVRSERLTLLSLEANQLSRMATMAAFGGLYLAVTASSTPVRLTGAFGGAGALAAVAMTGSRTGFAATAFAILVLVVWLRSRFVLLLLAGTGMVTAVLLAVSNVGQNALGSLLRDGTGSSEAVTSLTGRTSIWPLVLDVVREHPLTGHGLGTDTLLLSPRSVELSFVAEHTHNALLHLLLTTGVVGTGLFLAAMVAAFRRTPASGRPWLGAITAYLLIAGVTEALLRNPDITLVAVVFAVTTTRSMHRPAARAALVHT